MNAELRHENLPDFLEDVPECSVIENDPKLSNALDAFPEPTLAQLEEMLEERVLPDRRRADAPSLAPGAVDRRYHDRRSS